MSNKSTSKREVSDQHGELSKIMAQNRVKCSKLSENERDALLKKALKTVSDKKLFTKNRKKMKIWLTHIKDTDLYGCYFTSEPTMEQVRGMTGHGDDVEIVEATLYIHPHRTP